MPLTGLPAAPRFGYPDTLRSEMATLSAATIPARFQSSLPRTKPRKAQPHPWRVHSPNGGRNLSGTLNDHPAVHSVPGADESFTFSTKCFGSIARSLGQPEHRSVTLFALTRNDGPPVGGRHSSSRILYLSTLRDGQGGHQGRPCESDWFGDSPGPWSTSPPFRESRCGAQARSHQVWWRQRTA